MKNLNSILLSLIILTAIFTPAFAQKTDVYSCVTDLVIDEKPKRAGVSSAVFQPSKKWIPGQQLRIKFLDGNEFVKNKVRQNAEIWEQFANIDFVFVESGTAEIRISFGMDKGSWSFFGKDSEIRSHIKRGNASEFVFNNTGASMNFGWFNDKTSDEDPWLRAVN